MQALDKEFSPKKKNGFINNKKCTALPFPEKLMSAQARLIPERIIEEEFERKANTQSVVVDYFLPGALDIPLGGEGPHSTVTPRELLHGIQTPGEDEKH